MAHTKTRCANCGLSVYRLRSQSLRDASDSIYNILTTWVTPTVISRDSHVCYECWAILLEVEGSVCPLAAYGHRHVCLSCGTSILRARNVLVKRTSLEAKILKKKVPLHLMGKFERVCLACFTRARRAAAKHSSGARLQVDLPAQELPPTERFQDKEVQTMPVVECKAVQACPVRSRSKKVQVTTLVDTEIDAVVGELVNYEAEKTLVHIYKYLCEELEMLKAMTLEQVLALLEPVKHRTALAAGVSQVTLQHALVSHGVESMETALHQLEAVCSNSRSVESTNNDLTREESDMEVDCGGVETVNEVTDWRVPSPPGEACDTHGDSTDEALEDEPEIKLDPDILIKNETFADDINDSNPLDMDEPPPPFAHNAPTPAHTAPTPAHRHAHATTETLSPFSDDETHRTIKTEFPLDNHDHTYCKVIEYYNNFTYNTNFNGRPNNSEMVSADYG